MSLLSTRRSGISTNQKYSATVGLQNPIGMETAKTPILDAVPSTNVRSRAGPGSGSKRPPRDRCRRMTIATMHEFAHVRNSDGLSIDEDIMARQPEENLPPKERKAISFAVEQIIPPKQLESFITRVQPLYSAQRIAAFGASNHVHPALVIGQLQHRGEIAWSSFRRTMVPIRNLLVPNATTDGWGVMLPVHV